MSGRAKTLYPIIRNNENVYPAVQAKAKIDCRCTMIR